MKKLNLQYIEETRNDNNIVILYFPKLKFRLIRDANVLRELNLTEHTDVFKFA